MDYLRKKDRRNYAATLAANDNARLAIVKQTEMVSCLAQLSSVLGRGLSGARNEDVQNPVQAAPNIFTAVKGENNCGCMPSMAGGTPHAPDSTFVPGNMQDLEADTSMEAGNAKD